MVEEVVLVGARKHRNRGVVGLGQDDAATKFRVEGLGLRVEGRGLRVEG